MLTRGVCASSPLQLQMTRDTFSCSVVGCGGWSSGGLKWIWQQCVYGVGKRAVEPHDLNMKGVITVCVCLVGTSFQAETGTVLHPLRRCSPKRAPPVSNWVRLHLSQLLGPHVNTEATNTYLPAYFLHDPTTTCVIPPASAWR